MRWILVAVLGLWGVVAQAQGEDIRDVIESQIDAFQQDDFAQAFEFASPNIQSLFGSSDRFGQMVRNGYPMVWRPQDVRFLELREIAGGLWQRVMIRGPQGQIHMLDYQMVEINGLWRINAVQLLPAAQPSV
jgi:hypothetical protein